MKKKVLHINCHPLFNNLSHSTVQLSAFGFDVLSGQEHIDIEMLNLYDHDTLIPRVDELMFSVWDKQGNDLSVDEEIIYQAQETLLEQWIAADHIFIYSPLHNFNVTSKFKDYVDNLLIAKRTFKYTAEESVGLLSDHKKVIYIQSSGSEYEENIRYVHADHAPQYIRTILSFMGIKQLTVLRVQGLEVSGNNRHSIVDKAKSELLEYIQTYFPQVCTSIKKGCHSEE